MGKLLHKDTIEVLTHDTLSENTVIMTQYVDANLYHGIIMEREIVNNSHILIYGSYFNLFLYYVIEILQIYIWIRRSKIQINNTGTPRTQRNLLFKKIGET